MIYLRSLKNRLLSLILLLALLWGGQPFPEPAPAAAEGPVSRAFLPAVMNNFYRARRVALPLVGKKLTLGSGTLVGTVSNATTNNPIENVQVCVSAATCAQTDIQGNYVFSQLPMGTYPIAATIASFDTFRSRTFVNGRQENRYNIALSPKIGGGGTDVVVLRVILTWSVNPTWPDGTPNDLDLHMWLNVPDPPTHIYNDNRGDCTQFPNACLKTDMTWGSGPETIDISHIENAVYTVGVLNFNQSSVRPKVPPISATAAHISLHDLSGEFFSQDIPTRGNGDFWLAFRIIGNSTNNTYQVEPINCITGDPGDVIPTCQPVTNGVLPRVRAK